jgi:hypothetical protein
MQNSASRDAGPSTPFGPKRPNVAQDDKQLLIAQDHKQLLIALDDGNIYIAEFRERHLQNRRADFPTRTTN